jgi:hypothetical protein
MVGGSSQLMTSTATSLAHRRRSGAVHRIRFVGSLNDGGFPMASPVSVSLLDHFAALSDPRQHAKVLYALPEVLLLVLASTIAGADDFVETTLWRAEHPAFLGFWHDPIPGAVATLPESHRPWSESMT